MNQFLTFQKYDDIVVAERVAATLTAAGIPVSLEPAPPPLLDPVITGPQADQQVLVKIPSLYFVQAREILVSRHQVTLEETDPQHPLFSLTDGELNDVLAKPEEWGLDNFQLAQLILQQRGSLPPQEEIDLLQQQHIKTLAVPEQADAWWVATGYLIGLLWLGMEIVFLINGSVYHWFALPLLSPILLGWYIIQSKKTLPNGRQVLAFKASSRKHGYLLMALGILSLILYSFQVFIAGNIPLVEMMETL